MAKKPKESNLFDKKAKKVFAEINKRAAIFNKSTDKLMDDIIEGLENDFPLEEVNPDEERL